MLKEIQKYFSEFIYLFIIFFFCYTSMNKLINLSSFKTNLIKTSLFNEANANWFSIAVILIEFIVVLFMVFRKKLGLLIVTIMLMIFTTYISYLRYKGFYEVCGCGGILNGLSYKHHLTINILLILASFYSLFTLNQSENEK